MPAAGRSVGAARHVAMERVLKWLDELDDLRAVLRVQAGPVVVTILLLVAFLAALAGAFVLGPPDLLASP